MHDLLSDMKHIPTIREQVISSYPAAHRLECAVCLCVVLAFTVYIAYWSTL